jgi:hypothetical protein
MENIENVDEEVYVFALLDSEDNVLNVILLDKDDDIWANFLAVESGAKKAISCKRFGLATIGGKWNGECFVDENGQKVPFTAKPFDNTHLYEYNEELKKWVNVGPNPFVNPDYNWS